MRILLIGATGTIGKAVASALSSGHELIRVSHSKGEYRVDLADPASIRELYRKVGRLDAVIIAAGVAKFAPFASLTDADFALSLFSGFVGILNYGINWFGSAALWAAVGETGFVRLQLELF